MTDGATGTTGSVRARFEDIIQFIRSRPRLIRWLIAAPPFTVLVIFFALPLLTMVFISFQTDTGSNLLALLDGSVTLQNYVEFFTSEVYLSVLWRTLLISVEVTVIVAVVGYALAYSIVRFSRRTTLLLLLIILPFWTSYIIRMYAWINILQRGGVLDSTLVLLGFDPVSLLYTETAVMIGFTYIWLPLAVLPFYASLTNMDPDLIESAKDLGAGPLKAFFTVTLPTTIDGVVTGVVLVFIPTFGSFITPTLLGGTNSVMIGMVIASQFKRAFDWPFGATIGIIVSLVVVALLVVVARFGGNLLSGGEA